MKTKNIKELGVIIFSCFIFGTVRSIPQTVKQQTLKEQSSTIQDSLSECITIEEMLQQIDERDKRLESTKNSEQK